MSLDMTIFRFSSYAGEIFNQLILEKTQIKNIEFQSCQFKQCKFLGVTFKKVTFTDCDFESCDLSLSKFRGCKFSEEYKNRSKKPSYARTFD
jgi:uncharacterized protein YjbI with pentapeptide repeats